MQFDNRITQIFHVDRPKQYRLKLIYQNGKPMLGFSLFFQRGTNWYPGRKHFYIPVDGWKGLMSMIGPFNAAAMQGNIFYYISFGS